MQRIKYFDYLKLAKENGVSNGVLKKIELEVKQEFPDDKMMFELHVLRAINSGYRPKIS